eukprot:CAMPEP_0178416662 /NCGR_PEP_ID=MMETSP0689_2-20121128/24178_1 /TAXON_ID=160604 /ORGANISM="Amphidinium massartii, Strain CS-259" /LENGTH=459 /DNA_ID=CAMNT_0020038011 /DNA_START=44 /DNA_END=1419 /DNA_ORIENTATION=+
MEGTQQRRPEEAGNAIIHGLLQKPQGEVTEWLLDQVALLQQESIKVEELPVFQVASALKTVSTDEKQALTRSVVQGFGSLPASRRAEAVRLAIKAQSVVQQAENLELTRLAEREHAKAMQRLAALERSGGSSTRSPVVVEAASQAHLAEAGAGGGQSAGASAVRGAPLVENLLRVAKEARFNEMPQEELVTISQTAQREATRVVQPKQLLDVVTELNANEREQLTSALVEAHVVPEGQRGVLEEAVRPGGYADKLASALEFGSKLRPYAWIAVVLPVVEFGLAMILGLLPCGVQMVAWLRADSLLMLFFVIAGLCTAHIFAPVYEKLQADPFGTVQRWQSSAEDIHKAKSLRLRLQVAVPDVPFDTYRYTALGCALCAVLVVLGALWAVVGVFYVLGAMALGCNPLTLIVCILFVTLRFALIIGMVLLLFYVLDEIQKHRSRQVMLGSVNIPMTEEAQV